MIIIEGTKTMKVVILAGGLPSSISDETDRVPKPMVKIGERPILWHIMKLYSSYGFNDFLICTGYKAETIKEYFLDYYIYSSDITVDLQNNDITIHNKVSEPWKVTVVDTGLNSTTGERIRKIKNYIGEDAFIVCYGDCITDLNITDFLSAYYESPHLVLMAVARPSGRNAVLNLDASGNLASDIVLQNNCQANAWVNTCHMVLSKEIFSYLTPGESFETTTINRLRKTRRVATYKHEGFWMPVETMRDKLFLEELWQHGNAPWKVW